MSSLRTAVSYTHLDVYKRQHLQRALQLKPGSTVARYEWARLERTEGQVEEMCIRDRPRPLRAVLKRDLI